MSTEPSTPKGPGSETPYRQPSPGVELGGVASKRHALNSSSDLISGGEGEDEGGVKGGGEFTSPSLSEVRRGSVKDLAQQFSGNSRYSCTNSVGLLITSHLTTHLIIAPLRSTITKSLIATLILGP